MKGAVKRAGWCLLYVTVFLLFQSAESDEFPRPLRSVRTAETEYSGRKENFSGSGYDPDASILLNSQNLNHDLVQYYIKQYTSPAGLQWLKAIRDRGGPYLGFIQQEIKERNLPDILVYLPVIESGFLTTAVSRSGAMGLWQFMKNSIAPFDMKVNEWLDERRDFWKSTQGALKKLEDNYQYFKDWPLALAAYNAGLGAVSAIVKSSGIHDYWILSERKLLKTETIHYVPKFLAAACILSNPRQFGLDPLWVKDPHWTRIAVDRPIDLNLLAAEAGISAAELKNANQELTYTITPPGNYFLKIKAEDTDKVLAILARKDLPLINYYIHTIRSGDTLLALAIHYGITVDQIIAMNPGVQAQFLRIGRTLMIPAIKETGPYRQAAAGENLVFSGSYQVKKGDTLWSLALAFGIAPEALAEANNMELNDILREGRILKTPIRE